MVDRADRSRRPEPGIDALHLPFPKCAVLGLSDVALQLRNLVKDRVLREVSDRLRLRVPPLEVPLHKLRERHQALRPGIVEVVPAHLNRDGALAARPPQDEASRQSSAAGHAPTAPVITTGRPDGARSMWSTRKSSSEGRWRTSTVRSGGPGARDPGGRVTRASS
eukprot:CAMPEP_0177581406 /NCGR_PEP_ID=MMETSP0419_2-20121207/2131_1 /TAXON_ID=582737 /ORGANISM="Tetraselmis sp., Strain GSL018" /LENGTH=164 /DNA_ID=CAMNT_0019070447 /DNA_START=477 /DNA_END=968 /DNA_ORIENTATION=-